MDAGDAVDETGIPAAVVVETEVPGAVVAADGRPFVAVCSGQVCLNEGVGMAARRIPAPRLFRSLQATW